MAVIKMQKPASLPMTNRANNHFVFYQYIMAQKLMQEGFKHEEIARCLNSNSVHALRRIIRKYTGLEDLVQSAEHEAYHKILHSLPEDKPILTNVIFKRGYNQAIKDVRTIIQKNISDNIK